MKKQNGIGEACSGCEGAKNYCATATILGIKSGIVRFITNYSDGPGSVDRYHFENTSRRVANILIKGAEIVAKCHRTEDFDICPDSARLVEIVKRADAAKVGYSDARS
jgi:hypothetical protein